jgi:hypothetical protein
MCFGMTFKEIQLIWIEESSRLGARQVQSIFPTVNIRKKEQAIVSHKFKVFESIHLRILGNNQIQHRPTYQPI